jgi:hypothetical protein
MSRKFSISVACLAIAVSLMVPATSGAAGGLTAQLAADACKAEKSKLGKKGFAKRYGAKKPLKACAKKAKADANKAVSEATDECLLELQEYGDEEFYADWGTFSACVEDYAAWIMDGGGFEEDDSEDDEDAGVL